MLFLHTKIHSDLLYHRQSFFAIKWTKKIKKKSKKVIEYFYHLVYANFTEFIKKKIKVLNWQRVLQFYRLGFVWQGSNFQKYVEYDWSPFQK